MSSSGVRKQGHESLGKIEGLKKEDTRRCKSGGIHVEHVHIEKVTIRASMSADGFVRSRLFLADHGHRHIDVVRTVMMSGIFLVLWCFRKERKGESASETILRPNADLRLGIEETSTITTRPNTFTKDNWISSPLVPHTLR